MRRLARIAGMIFLSVLVLFIIVFVVENQQRFSLTFLGFSFPEVAASVALLLAFLLGMLTGPLTIFLKRSKQKLMRPLG